MDKKIKVNLKDSLIEKLHEWGNEKFHIELVVDVFSSTMNSCGYNDDEKLEILEEIITLFNKEEYKDIYDVIKYNILCIKVNAGY